MSQTLHQATAWTPVTKTRPSLFSLATPHSYSIPLRSGILSERDSTHVVHGGGGGVRGGLGRLLQWQGTGRVGLLTGGAAGRSAILRVRRIALFLVLARHGGQRGERKREEEAVYYRKHMLRKCEELRTQTVAANMQRVESSLVPGPHSV